MRFTFHGCSQEVGRSCVEVKTKNENFLFDCGLKLGQERVEYPIKKKGFETIDAVFLSHAHLDHSGALPLFHYHGLRGPIFCTKTTRDLTKLLLRDSYKIELLEGMDPAYSKLDIKGVMNMMKNVQYNQTRRFKNLHYTYYDAAHIPGAAMIKVQAEKNILYTGDIKLSESRLLRGSHPSLEDIDILITETTYGDREHANRQKQISEFIRIIKKTLNNGGSVLIPAFAVGRAQEIMLILKNENLGVDVYTDGMANKATNIFLNNPTQIKNDKELAKCLKKFKRVKGQRQRKEIVKEQAIFITTSGMLDGGPVIVYLKHLWHNPKNAILLTGYQAEGTNGRLLMEEGHVFLDGVKTPIKGTVKKFDFSAHIGKKELTQFIKKVNPEKLMLVHGDPPSMKSMEQWAKQNGLDVVAPRLGEKINL